MTCCLNQKLDALVARHADGRSRARRRSSRPRPYVKLSREFAELAPVVETVKAYRGGAAEIAELDAMLADPATDPEMRALAEAEKPALEARREALEQQDPRRAHPQGRDGRAQRHPGNPRRHRRRRGRAVRRRSVPHVRALSPPSKAGRSRSSRRAKARMGGYKEIIAEISGRGAFAKLKFESGVHRVQRVPDTEALGPHPHLGRDRRGAAGGRGGRRRRSTRPTSRSTPCAPAAPAASTSTRPNPRSASPTCRPASW